MRSPLLRHPIINNLLQAVTIAVLGFVLLNLTFIVDAAYQGVMRFAVSRLVPMETLMNVRWYPTVMHLSFLVMIGLISWPIFKSKLPVIYKSIYLAVPLATMYVTMGMFLFSWPIAVYTLGAVFGAGVLYYLYRTKQPWQYFYVLLLTTAVLALMLVFDVDI